MRNIIFKIIVFSFAFASIQEIDDFHEGEFEVYEKNEYVGKFYRKGNYQIESFPDGSETFAKIEFKSDSTLLMSGIEKVKKGIDSIIILVHYKKIDSDKFKIIGTTYNIESDYKYESIIKKVSKKVKMKYLKKLDSLNKNGA